MNDVATVARALRAGEICREHGITQVQIADAIGASQSQVSRVLSGQGIRHSRLMEEVCLYVEQFSVGVTADAVRGNAELIEAIQATWDGSATHARALSTVIRSLAVLRRKPEADVRDSTEAQT